MALFKFKLAHGPQNDLNESSPLSVRAGLSWPTSLPCLRSIDSFTRASRPTWTGRRGFGWVWMGVGCVVVRSKRMTSINGNNRDLKDDSDVCHGRKGKQVGSLS
jgi:hypothetical protein